MCRDIGNGRTPGRGSAVSFSAGLVAACWVECEGSEEFAGGLVDDAEIGEHLNEMRVELLVSRNAVTIVESRPPWDGEAEDEWVQQEVARLRFERSRGWTLYWPDRNSDFHTYDRLTSTMQVKKLPDEVDADPTCIFWG